MSDQPLVLGIETSCDETGVGIVRGETLLVDAIASSVDEHARFCLLYTSPSPRDS